MIALRNVVAKKVFEVLNDLALTKTIEGYAAFGSAALEYYFPDAGIRPQDIDIMISSSGSFGTAPSHVFETLTGQGYRVEICHTEDGSYHNIGNLRFQFMWHDFSNALKEAFNRSTRVHVDGLEIRILTLVDLRKILEESKKGKHAVHIQKIKAGL